MKHTIDAWGETWSDMTGRLNALRAREEIMEQELENLREEIGNLYQERSAFDKDFKEKRCAELLEVFIGMAIPEASELCRVDYEIFVENEGVIPRSGDDLYKNKGRIVVTVADEKITTACVW